MTAPTRASICVLGSGPAGLITAYTLIQDGFENVKVFTRDSTPGGVWAAERVYPGITLNNIHGELRFSTLPMPPPQNSEKTGGRLKGEDLQAYFESFADRFLKGKIQFNTEVQRIRRSEPSGWRITVQDSKSGKTFDLDFDKFVLCSGGCSSTDIPSILSPEAAKQAGFRGLVVHSFDLASALPSLLDSVKPLSDPNPGRLLVIGGGKSAQDVSAIFAHEGRNVPMLFETADGVLAAATPLPDFIRKSRMLSLITPHMELRTRLERFLHTTWLGSFLIRRIWKFIASDSFKALNTPESSPLRRAHNLFWSLRSNDEGVADLERFYGLVNAGKIELVAPTRAVRYVESQTEPSGHTITVELSDGQLIKANAVVVCTGFASSWEKLFDEETREYLGLSPCPALPSHEFNYATLNDPPAFHHDVQELKRIPLYRGLVPAKNILKRDFAINGTSYTTNFGYTVEVNAHWISSYFLEDCFLWVPFSPKEAIENCNKHSAWWRKRYPNMLVELNETYSSGFAFLKSAFLLLLSLGMLKAAILTCSSWPQATDALLEDMDLPTMRSGGTWLTWPFQVIDLKELESLHEERVRKRRLSTNPNITRTATFYPYSLA